ncbi:MDMPI N domain containing protein [Streptomyces acidiscabies]|uniref:MDMPI N domain containing protein n=1 Tax=Streptomyces acidiscabies TaxID=42234 RepID=A0AAP6BD34_9ACTN|nr:MDMPI N domain containing protein [Streptomyces acidiscabies]MBZ3910009.1 MDMPI N domain containing protein [Streptomyces acidiscabies]MDX2962516.1 MDMPI N domain containing protein [Streptomyces acidiscabies]MDX3789897.1 MDMPI N domain containing protein [Streptomyces acidiscabies]
MTNADRHAEDPFDPDEYGAPGVPGTPGPGRPSPRIPLPRAAAEDDAAYPAVRQEGGGVPAPPTPPLEHPVLKSLLGGCGACADEARRLREAVGLLQRPEPLDLDPGLRTRVLASCLERRPPRIPVPEWALSYDAEAARLDALLQDFGDSEWHAPVRLRWFTGERQENRRTTVAGVIAHLHAVDGLVAVALGLDDPLRGGADDVGCGPVARTEFSWRSTRFPHTRTVRAPWRAQAHDIVRTASFTGGSAGGLGVSYGDFELPLRDALLDRAFECWVHADDIAQAVDYPYDPPAPRHLRAMIELAARMLPAALAERRLAGLASPGRTRHLVPAGHPGRSLRLEIEGLGGGEWFIPLDSPAAVGSAEYEVAHVALDGVEFCQLAAGHIAPDDAAAGQVGDREAIRDVLFAAAALSRM